MLCAAGAEPIEQAETRTVTTTSTAATRDVTRRVYRAAPERGQIAAASQESDGNPVKVCISREVRGVRMEQTSSGLGLSRGNTFARFCRPLAPIAVAALAVTSAAASALVPVTQAAAVGGVQVFVSYADDARPLIANFPNPWAGSPNVTFDGCATSACLTSGFDAGAVRVENDTAVMARLQTHSTPPTSGSAACRRRVARTTAFSRPSR